MRKIILAVMALLCLLTACSQTTEVPEERDNVGQITYVGICFANGEDPAYRQTLEKELLRLGYYVNFADAKGDQSVQHQQIDSFVAQQYDALIVEPVMTAAADTILQRLETAQIPAVLLGKQPDTGVLDTHQKACFVGFDYPSAALLQGQMILNAPNRGDVNGDGQVVYAILAGPEGNIYTGMHIDGCATVLKENDAQLQMLGVVYGDHTQESGKALTEGLLSRYGRDMEVLFCGSDALALGALEALSKSGRTVNQDIYVVGIGGEAEVLSLVEQGLMTGTAVADYDALALQAAKATEALLAGNTQQMYLLDYLPEETP